MQPLSPPGRRGMFEPPAGIEPAEINVRIGPDLDRLLPWFAGKQQGEIVWPGCLPERFLSIPRHTPARLGHQPDLQKMDPLFGRGIEFAVHYTATGADVLQVTGLDDTPIAHAVFVLQFAFDDITEDFRVPVRMFAKTTSGFHHVIIDDPQ